MSPAQVIAAVSVADPSKDRKKTKNVIYYNSDNTYIFDVSQYDKTNDQFEAFVSELDKRIKKAKEST